MATMTLKVGKIESQTEKKKVTLNRLVLHSEYHLRKIAHQREKKMVMRSMDIEEMVMLNRSVLNSEYHSIQLSVALERQLSARLYLLLLLCFVVLPRVLCFYLSMYLQYRDGLVRWHSISMLFS